MCKAGSNAFDTDGDAMTFSGTELEFDHFPGAEHTGCQPKVVVLVPVLILGGPQLGTESCRTNFAILVKREAILQKLPGQGFPVPFADGPLDPALAQWSPLASGGTRREYVAGPQVVY